MRHVAGWQDHFDEKQTTGRVHCLAYKAEDRKASIFVPVMDDVRKNISVCPDGNRLEEIARQAGLALDPGFTIQRFQASASSDNPVYLAGRERIYQGMRIAGVPER